MVYDPGTKYDMALAFKELIDFCKKIDQESIQIIECDKKWSSVFKNK